MKIKSGSLDPDHDPFLVNAGPGGKGLVVAPDTSAYNNKHLYQVTSDSFDT
jgi:hypothetical protein